MLFDPPTLEESQAAALASAWAVSPPGGLQPLQRVLITAIYKAMTAADVTLDVIEPIEPDAFADLLRERAPAFRTRVVQAMLLPALVLRPIPAEVVERVAAFARAAGVDEGMLEVADRFAHGSLGLAAFDFERNGYTAGWHPEYAEVLHTSKALETAWEECVHDDELAARWCALGDLPAGTLGRRVWELYRARGFHFPGQPGSAPPLLAQHDWVHVLADYGTTVESELEVFAFIARANDDPHAFSLLAMVVSLFETGYLRSGAGLFESDLGHLSANLGVAPRLADAMRRGALCHDEVTGADSIDFLRLDWFALADLPVEDVRARFRLVPKSDDAVLAGSVGPWETGGISPFQLRAGQEAADRDGRSYEAYGATVTGSTGS